MWALTLFAALLLYEASRHLLGVWIAGRLRWRMAILALASIYPHYYGFWTLWGYLNDDFYEQVFYLDYNGFNDPFHLGSTSAAIQFNRGHKHSDGAQACRLQPSSLAPEADGGKESYLSRFSFLNRR